MISRASTAFAPLTALKAYIAAALVVPLLLFTLAARYDYQQLKLDARERAARNAVALAEHAQRVLAAQDSALQRVDEQTRSLTPQQLRGPAIHQWLRQVADEADYVVAISLIAGDGSVLASSLQYPTPATHARDRDYFRVFADSSRRGVFVSEPIIGRPSGLEVFQLARRRTSSDAPFAGVLVASVTPSELAGFYHRVTAAGDSVTLARADGTVLVRYPAVNTGVKRLPENSGLMRSVAGQPEAGFYRTRSHLDRVERLHAYRKVGRWPVYVSYGSSLDALAAQWRRDLAILGAITGLASILLLGIGAIAVRRAHREQAALARVGEEAEARARAEAEARAASERAARAEAELALQTSEERLRAITDAMPVLISYVDAEQRFRFVNKAYEAWFGRPLAEIAGRSLREVMGERMYAARRPWVEQALAGEPVSYEVEFPRGSEQRRTVVQHIPHRGPDGTVLGMYALVQDVTEQKRVEAALRESRDRLQAVLDAAPAAILIASEPDCLTIEANRRATELMRMDPAQNLSRSNAASAPRHFRIFSAEGRELEPHELPVQRAARGEQLFQHEERVEFDDGSSVYLLGNAVPLRDGGGAITGAIGAFIDITDRKRAEEHQRLLINELNHRVKNTLAIVQGLAQQSFRNQAAPEVARANFEGRLAALSAAHSILTRQNWVSALLGDVVAAAAAPFGAQRFKVEGPEISLAPQLAVNLALALHELGTNAFKYGALSAQGGWVEVRWHIEEDRLRLVWEERGGPPVEAPKARGFGTRMIERGLAAELRGKVSIDFAPGGLVCTIDAPLPVPA